jgi:Glycosyl hydrolases family 18
MIAGVYFESWDDWKGRLETIDPKFNVVYLAFADPRQKPTYNGWEGTGLGFTHTPSSVKEDIAKLKARGCQVLLSVGGATYPFPENFNAYEMVRLANFLGCDGIDIDWEPAENGSTDGWGEIIKEFYFKMIMFDGVCKLLTAAVWSTGCMQPVSGNRYRGINIPGLVKYGSYLNWLNIMAYDCGPPTDVDPLGCFYTYRVYFPGPLVMGFLPGKMGWGDYLTTKEDVIKGMEYARNDSENNGYFIWSYYKDDFVNGVTRDYIVEEGKKAWENKVEVLVPMPQTGKFGLSKFNIQCPFCNNCLGGELKLTIQ